MSPWQENAERRARECASDRGRELIRRLGAGYDGVYLADVKPGNITLR